MFKASRWGVLLTGAFAAGCGSIFDSVKNCTTQFVYGLQVDVLDSLTTAPAGKGAVVVARDRGYADTARSALPSGSPGEEEKSFVLAGERRGTYEVTVERAGYQLWRESGVRVTADACHVRTARLTARLTRTP